MSPGELRLTYAMLYVMFSRVQQSENFRCLPLSKGFDKRTLYNLRPSIGATKWRMDIGKDGLWSPRFVEGVKKCCKRFRSNKSLPLALNNIDDDLKHVPIQPSTNANKREVKTKASNNLIELALDIDMPNNSFSKSSQNISREKNENNNVQQPMMEVSNNERVLFYERQNVYIADLNCLQNGRWLYEHVIMMFLEIEHQNHENILLCDFSMYNSWLQRTLQIGMNHQPTDLISDFILHNSQLYQYLVWIIPIHEHNHYQLLIITNPRLSSRRYFLFDSKKSPLQEVKNINHLKGFIKCLLQSCSSLLLHDAEHIDENCLYIIVPKVHQQPNSDDCGLYTILNGINAMKNTEQLLDNNSGASLDLTHWYTERKARGYRIQLQTVELQRIRQTQLGHLPCINTTASTTNGVKYPLPTFIADCGMAWTYIHADVINYFFQLMMQKYPHVKAQPTYFFQQLNSDNDWSTYVQRRIIGRNCPNHDNFIKCLQDKECTTILPMGANNHWTVLVKRFVVSMWKLQYADSITDNSFSSMSLVKRIFLNTPVSLNDEAVTWQNIHLQPQTEYECGARMCVAAVFLSLVDSNVLAEKIRCFNRIAHLSQKSRDMVQSICINKTFSIPLWLQHVIYD